MDDVQIIEAHDGEDLDAARALILEYAETRGFPLSWQGFDEEYAGLPGDYAPPSGLLLVARADRPAGVVALRRVDEEACEMKRLYVRPDARGLRVGRLLCERLIGRAREFGYRAMLLDTLERMEEATALYRALGFVETEPYRYNPLPDVHFLRLDL